MIASAKPSVVPNSQAGSRIKPLASYWGLFKKAFSDWSEDHATRLAASLAFYTMLSLAPLLVLAIKVVGMIFSEDSAKAQVTNYLQQLMGPTESAAVGQMIGSAGKPGAGIMATVISLVILLFSASGVFGELQDSLNTIWEVKPRPGRGILGVIKDRFFSLVLVLGVCFLLLVSLVATTALSGITSHLSGNSHSFIWQAINFIVSAVIITLLFALMFKYLPDVKIVWHDVWIGAITTGLLFSFGKLILGWYLGRASTTSVYGAAGSLIAVLLWVYYSAQILFFGAELTRAEAYMTRTNIKPTDNAVKITAEERAQQGLTDPAKVQDLTQTAEKEESPTGPDRFLTEQA